MYRGKRVEMRRLDPFGDNDRARLLLTHRRTEVRGDAAAAPTCERSGRDV